MEQMYMVEIFIDKVGIFVPEGEESAAEKKLIIKVNFGPKTQFIIKEGQLANNDPKKNDSLIECDALNRRMFTRTVRVGKSMLFPSYPDTVLKILNKFPLEIEVWNDDENEVNIFVGTGKMLWDREFYMMLKETAEDCKHVDPLSIKQMVPITGECGCKQVGEVHFILRLSPLGENIITEFQQLLNDPETFVFRTNRAPSMFQCKRIEDGDPNFCMVGSLYETTTLEDPNIVDNAHQKIEICTELQSCGVAGGSKAICEHKDSESSIEKKRYPIDKIRMGDITGPCGNTNCVLAHKVKTYLRSLDTYKQEAEGKVSGNKDENRTKNICGTCVCKDERWHREECTESGKEDAGKKVPCTGCGGQTKPGGTCEERQNRTGSGNTTPKQSKVTVAYVYNCTQVPGFKESLSLGQNAQNNSRQNRSGGCCCGKPNLDQSNNKNINSINTNLTSYNCSVSGGCGCRKSPWKEYENKSTDPAVAKACDKVPVNNPPAKKIPNTDPLVYNVSMPTTNQPRTTTAVYNCTAIPENKDCRCDPPKPRPPCSTFDCECIPESINIAARKQHKPYCPSYKHKVTCPVSKMNEEQVEDKKKDEDEDEPVPLPYGLPPIELGPCPVMGRPCTVADGFQRMYKTAAMAAQPPSYSDAGKVCCTKEYERIKKALKEYMKYEKDNDYRCLNRFDVDTERRCCDKEQMLLAMSGKSCCGTHKLDIQEKFKDKN